MHLSLTHLTAKQKYRAIIFFLLSLSMICAAFTLGDNDGFEISRREIMLRRIGHEILLQSGDSTSRVLPVRRVGEFEYQVSFGRELSFRPDSLVNLTSRLLVRDPLSSDYIVNVLNCGDGSVAYGYAISGDSRNDIVTCKGRIQPKACYMVSIKFKPSESLTAKIPYVLGGLALLMCIGYFTLRRGKPQGNAPELKSIKIQSNTEHSAPEPTTEADLPSELSTETFALGTVVFNARNRTLKKGDTVIDLTATESRVLKILATSPNEIIERSRLQKEIWEDEGVIVGRSLDMFISKLRKKLGIDPGLKITVIRAKGYRLEIAA